MQYKLRNAIFETKKSFNNNTGIYDRRSLCLNFTEILISKPNY